ncbi:hypothetical protein GCM10007388_16050 [Pseudoduganella plicata]|uniref:Uncharacterized protein n=1 Tax=Pseudoduganella plicata TaxID=321984 RepID=A0AA87Y1S8_9BURK|nr:hypothetical protein GCM10007388_16050 [Pseudoduganella plicata]
MPLRRLFLVVQAARNHRAIGIAIEERHDYFLTDARHMEGAPVLSGIRIADTHPARRALVAGILPVPAELDLYAVEVIRVHLFAGGSDHDGCLRMQYGLCMLEGAAKRHLTALDFHPIKTVPRMDVGCLGAPDLCSAYGRLESLQLRCETAGEALDLMGER